MGRELGDRALMSVLARVRPVVQTLRQRPTHPSHLAGIAGDLVRSAASRSRAAENVGGRDRPYSDTSMHLQTTMDWLCRAQDVGEDRGVATAYSFRNGWAASYPETTGYIVPTFFDYSASTGQPVYAERALEMGEWLLSIQMEDGAFQAGPINQPPRPSVFNTGQILLGLVRLYRETGADRYLESVERASDWLLEVQDPDGTWSQFAYYGIAHSYYSRVAWALLEAFAVTGRDDWKEGAIRQLGWTFANQVDSGWFTKNSFQGQGNPFTHTVVYAAEGLFGAGLVLEEQGYVDSAAKVANALQRKFEAEGFLPGELDANWSSDVRYSCLTGDAQLAGLLLGLHGLNGDESSLQTAVSLNRYLKSTQKLGTRNPGIRGGVKGSDPIWGGYMTYSYPNWAAKFLADALMLEEQARERTAAGDGR